MDKVRTKAAFISATTTINICRYPKDNFLLALSQEGNATHYLTGDKDLLVLKKIGKAIILKIAGYRSKK